LSALFYSALFAVAGAAYGLQGVSESGVWTLKQRVIANHYHLYHGLFWIALMAGILGEVLNQVFCSIAAPVSLAATRGSRRRVSQKQMIASRMNSGKRRSKK
jgi:hypothetical protein